MTIATTIRPETTEIHQPSFGEYDEIILQDGIAQCPKSVERYLVHIGLNPRAILFIQLLESYPWEPGQEVFLSVRTIAKKIGVGGRQTHHIFRKLIDLGLIRKSAQTTNGYSLDLLYRKVAAWLDPEVAIALAEAEAKEQEAFQPVDVIDQTAQVLCKAYSEGRNYSRSRSFLLIDFAFCRACTLIVI